VDLAADEFAQIVRRLESIYGLLGYRTAKYVPSSKTKTDFIFISPFSILDLNSQL